MFAMGKFTQKKWEKLKKRKLGTKKEVPFLLGKGRIPEKQREAKRIRLEKLKK